MNNRVAKLRLRIMRASAAALFEPMREVSLEEICGADLDAESDRCDGCWRAAPLVTHTAASSIRSRRGYCAQCAQLLGEAKPPPHGCA